MVHRLKSMSFAVTYVIPCSSSTGIDTKPFELRTVQGHLPLGLLLDTIVLAYPTMAHLMTWKHKASALGHRIAPRTALSFEIARRNRHFEKEYWLLPHFCDRKSNAIDVGGNTGLYAFYLSRLARKVHVFEPNPICLDQIARIKRRNMVIHNLALSNHSGEAIMRFDPNNTGIGTIEGANRLDQNSGIRRIVEQSVKICPLDDLGLENISFIKIDVEGHEPSVLRGAIRLLGTEKPILLIEIENRHNPHSFEEIDRLLAGLGYSAWRLSRDRLVPVRAAEVQRMQRIQPSPDSEYVNNFIFVPPQRSQVLEKIGLAE